MRARVVNPEATEQEIKEVIESGRGSQIFMQAVSSPLFLPPLAVLIPHRR
jgi:t-SNARE complex subunit (syntaxin)